MLQVTNLKKKYGDISALDGVSFQATPGRILGLLGPNGSGKTTTMRSIFGLIALDAGKVHWQDHAVTSQDRLNFGYMPEQRGLYPKMKIHDQLVYFGRLHGLNTSTARKAADQQLNDLGLGARGQDPVETLSHGNQQRVQFAVALLHQPGLLVLDEPFSGLDPIGTETLGKLLRQQLDHNCTIIFSSHQLDLVQHFCDDIVLVHKGKVRVSGPLHEIRTSATRRRLDLTFDTPTSLTPASGEEHPAHHTQIPWLPSDAEVEVLAYEPRNISLRIPHDLDITSLIQAASQVGHIASIAYQPPTLSEIFLDTVREDVNEQHREPHSVDHTTKQQTAKIARNLTEKTPAPLTSNTADKLSSEPS